MPRKKSLIFSALALVAICVFLAAPESASAARKEKVLYKFCSEYACEDGTNPSDLILDAAGNLYGTTFTGGEYGFGVVFQLTPGAGGTWSEKVLYNFCSLQDCADGAYPSSGLIFDAAGNLYGVTYGGDTQRAVAYQLTPGADGAWTESVLYTFSDGVGAPCGDLVFDTAGNLYGAADCYVTGAIFELKPQGDGMWSEETLYTFQGSDGSEPNGPLVLDASGNLYGTTFGGGTYNSGVAFQLTPHAGGTWSEKVLHSFCSLQNCADGAYPFSGLIFDAAGNLYSTTANGGISANGTVFRLSPRTNGRWKETVLRRFQRSRTPHAGLIFDAAGNLYGTTAGGGPGCPHDGCGTVFKLNPTTRAYKVLCTISRYGKGAAPDTSLIFDAAGNLYGATELGGNGYGVAFEVVR